MTYVPLFQLDKFEVGKLGNFLKETEVMVQWGILRGNRIVTATSIDLSRAREW